jgi:hypothetical protein
VALSCVTPTEDHAGRFVILAEPIAAGKIGRAYAAGVCPVRVNVAGESHRFAACEPGDTGQLHSAPTGPAELLWTEAGTGQRWAVVRIGGGGATVEHGRPTQAFSSGQTIALNPVSWDTAASGWADNGLADATVYTRTDRQSLTADWDTDDVLSFVRFPASDGTAEGVLVGPGPTDGGSASLGPVEAIEVAKHFKDSSPVTITLDARDTRPFALAVMGMCGETPADVGTLDTVPDPIFEIYAADPSYVLAETLYECTRFVNVYGAIVCRIFRDGTDAGQLKLTFDPTAAGGTQEMAIWARILIYHTTPPTTAYDQEGTGH